jgi:hypothetical protein
MAGCCHHDHRETARADGTYRRVLWAALAINAGFHLTLDGLGLWLLGR